MTEKTIYIAYPGEGDSNGLADRAKLCRQLEQYASVTVLPVITQSKISDSQIKKDLEASDISVHFLGVRPGKVDRNEKGIVQRQFEIAEVVERAKAEKEGGSRRPAIYFLKSKELKEVEDSRLDPEEWDFDSTECKPSRDLRTYLCFLCRILKGRPPVRVFYSYAREDSPHLDSLRKSLITLRRSGKIIEWYDGLLDTGSDFNEQTSQELDDCDVLVYLITPSGIASSYAYHKEFKRAKDKKLVIPIAVESVDLEDTGIESIQSIPLEENGGVKRLKPVNEWESMGKGWEAVKSQIRDEFGKFSAANHVESERVGIEPCSDLGVLTEAIKQRFGLNARNPRNPYKKDLGPMIFLDWLERPVKKDPNLEQIKAHLCEKSRLTCAQRGLAESRPSAFTQNMYSYSDAVVLYCWNRSQETAERLLELIWLMESKRRVVTDSPRCVAVLDLSTEANEFPRGEFASAFPNGEFVIVIPSGDDEVEASSHDDPEYLEQALGNLLKPLWERLSV